MSKVKVKGNSLPPLQKRIIICLAEQGLQTVNATVKLLSKEKRTHYKATWIAFESLKGKGLIIEHNVQEYRGRKFPQFWLTMKGIVAALKNGANLPSLKENAKKLSDQPDVFDLFFDFAETLGVDFVEKAYTISSEGQFKLTSIPLLDSSMMEKMLKKIKKYPKWRKAVQDRLAHSLEMLEGGDEAK